MHIGVVEDDQARLGNLRFLLENEPGIGSVDLFRSAEKLKACKPWRNLDVLLVDLNLPGAVAVDLIAWMTARHPGTNCLAYTVGARPEAVFEAIRAGACGCLLKGAGCREMIDALHEVRAGGAPMSPSIARQVLQQFRRLPASGAPASASWLSPRELQILQFLERGETYKEIAARLSLSVHTVNSHLKHSYEKLHARSRGEAINLARQQGWL
jgi:two-component system NarL family response regulator